MSALVPVSSQHLVSTPVLDALARSALVIDLPQRRAKVGSYSNEELNTLGLGSGLITWPWCCCRRRQTRRADPESAGRPGLRLGV